MSAPNGRRADCRRVTLQVPGTQKGRWVAAARAEGKKLAEWVAETLDRRVDAMGAPRIDDSEGR